YSNEYRARPNNSDYKSVRYDRRKTTFCGVAKGVPERKRLRKISSNEVWLTKSTH
ncbi:uncharacterized protein METZ01_LOCUS515804, partial [marine metagenome]